MITFDFDSTLTKPSQDEDGIWWDTLNPNQEMIWRLRNLGEDRSIRIVTSRNQSQLEDVCKFVTKHQLPVSGIHATNGEPKVAILKELGSTLHFDDDSVEIRDIKRDLPSCKCVHIAMPDGTFF